MVIKKAAFLAGMRLPIPTTAFVIRPTANIFLPSTSEPPEHARVPTMGSFVREPRSCESA